MLCWHLPREASCCLSFGNVVFLSDLNKFDIEMIAWIWPIQRYMFRQLKMWRSHVMKKCVNDLIFKISRHASGLIYSVLPNDLILLCPLNRCNFVTNMFPIPNRWFLYRFSHMETFKRTDIRQLLHQSTSTTSYIRTYIEGFRSTYENYANLARI